MRQFILILHFCLTVSWTLSGQTLREVSIDQSEELLLVSKQIKDTFHIHISIPDEYYRVNRNYPIVYVLDSDKTFGMATDISRWLTFGEDLQPVLIVGISYRTNWWQKRSRDYTPNEDKLKNWGEWPLAGGADNFIVFIEKELNSSLAKYRVDWSNKTIIGLSFGGLFANYALLRNPALFDKYLIISPALIWNDKYLFSMSRNNLKQVKSNIKVFTAIGTLDENKIIDPWEFTTMSLQSATMTRSLRFLLMARWQEPDCCGTPTCTRNETANGRLFGHMLRAGGPPIECCHRLTSTTHSMSLHIRSAAQTYRR